MDLVLENLAVGRRSFDDPFFEHGDKVCGFFKRMCSFDTDEEELCHKVSKEFCCEIPGCTSTFETVMEFEIHYNTLHRYVCSVCHKILPSPHFLDIHIEENHDSFFSLQAAQKPMYQCLVEDCKAKFQTAGERKDHCLKTHFFPPNFRWFLPIGNKQKGKSKSSKPKPKKNVDSEMKEESLNSIAAESFMEEDTGMSTKQLQKKQKKPRQKHADKAVRMDAESEISERLDSPIDIPKEEIPNKQPDASQKTKKKPASFKGFIPRNVTANRAFYQKSSFKGRDWHQNAAASNVVSSLEGNNLSADLRESLLTDMEES